MKKVIPCFLLSFFSIQTFNAQVSYNDAATYSLRKVNPAYTGSAIQVRRTCDDATKDIGFTSCGHLDTAALKTFVVASNPLSSITSTAAAAFSLRKLNCIYAGSAIKVRRSCDNATKDIGFTASGDLDTTTLKNFVLMLNPLSSIAATQAVSYSLRKLNCSYAGSAIRVRRSSDNAVLDIGFTTNGDLDTTAMKTFIGANSGFVTIWYDQSGGGVNVSPPAAANEPRIINAGFVDRKNGMPTIFFDGVNDYFTTNAFPTAGYTGFTANVLAGWTTIGAGIGNIQALIDNDHNCTKGFVMQDRPDLPSKPITAAMPNGSSCNSAVDVITTGNNSLRIISYLNNTTTETMFRDGSSVSSAAYSGGYFIGTRFLIGAWHNSGGVSRFTSGRISEVIIFKSALSTIDRQFLEWNQSQYYAVSGPVFSSMPSGVQSVFVEKWYDQSGNARDASQATLGFQPRIMNAGVIERQGNQPAIKWLGAGYGMSTAGFTGYATAACFNGVARVSTDVTYNTIVNKCQANIPAPLDFYNGQIVIGNGGGYAFYGYGQTFNSTKPLNVWTYQGAASGTCEFYYNGTLSGSGAVSATFNDPGTPLVLGNRADGVTGLNGWISEVVTFGTIPSATDRQFLEWSQSQYYNISGIALGTLPVGAQNGFVNTWYDQSGLGIHAVQANPSNQPRIITTGIIEKNGTRPAIRFKGDPENLVAPMPVSSYPVTISCLANTSGLATNGAFVKLGGIVPGSSGIGVGVGATGTNFDNSGTSVIGLKEWTVWCPSTPGTAYPAVPFITTTTQETAGAGSAMNIFLNGTANVLTSQNSGTSGATITGNLFIGGYTNTFSRYPVVRESEVIIFGSSLNTTRRTLLETNQTTYHNLSGVVGTKYTPPTPTSYDLYVNGIGYTSATDSVAGTRSSVGMGFITAASSPFLQDNGDYMTAGINCPITASISVLNLPATVVQRWDNDWYVNKTDAGSNNGNLSFYFDFSDYGAGSTPGVAANYVLLYRTSPAANFTIVPGTTASVVGDRVQFLLDASNVTTNYYYTIGTKNASSSPLPIELISFESICKNNEVTLTWSTASETNNDHFSVEKSLDGITYQSIGRVNGAGNSTQKRNYSFTDKEVSAEYLYYRIAQIDFNGEQKHGNPVSVNCIQTEKTVSVYPNPSQNHFIVEGCKINSEVILFNQLGEKIISQQISSDKTEIDVSHLSNGIYFIQIEDSKNSSITKKLVIQH